MSIGYERSPIVYEGFGVCRFKVPYYVGLSQEAMAVQTSLSKPLSSRRVLWKGGVVQCQSTQIISMFKANP